MPPQIQPGIRLDRCQYLLVSQISYALTNFAAHTEQLGHDVATRYLVGDQVRPHLVWEKVQGQVVRTPTGCLVFDDTVVDKIFSHKIELVWRQYSGDAHGIIKGVGVMTCVYVNSELDQFWIIDYRIYDAADDGKTKLDHVHDMLLHAVDDKQVQFRRVLMDTWYATKNIMLHIEQLHEVYCCPLKSNSLADDSSGQAPYRHVNSLA